MKYLWSSGRCREPGRLPNTTVPLVTRSPRGPARLLATEGSSSGRMPGSELFLPVALLWSSYLCEALKDTPGEPALDEPEGKVHLVCLETKSLKAFPKV